MVDAEVKPSYQKSFKKALIFHALLVVGLVFESALPKASLSTPTARTETEMTMSTPKKPEPEPLKARAVDEQELVQKMNQIKATREKQRQVEVQRQAKLARDAENARIARITEQKRVEKLKQEADRIAVERKKKELVEEKRLKELEKKKAEEQKKLLVLKQQQEQLKKKQEEEAKHAKLEQARLEKERIEKARLEKERIDKEKSLKEKAANELAEKARRAEEAQRMERVAGEVDKYKALIVNAISREWILPDNADSQLSSQFRIRLAPDGTVLEVSLTRSSGDPILDRSAQIAIHKASPLPVPSDPDAFSIFRDIRLTVRPEQVRG